LKTVHEKEASITQLNNILNEKDSQLSDTLKTVHEKEASITQLNNILNEKDSQLSDTLKTVHEKEASITQLQSSLDKTRSDLIHSRLELQDIKNSIIYNSMHKFTILIDKCFPIHTSRGEFKNIVISSIQTIEKDGMKIFMKHAMEKIKRNEFKIITNANSTPIQFPKESQSDYKIPEMNKFNNTILNPQTKLGVNISGFISGELGLGEGVRNLIRAMDSVQMPYVLNKVSTPGHSDLDSSYSVFSDSNPYQFNIIHLNSDHMDFFYENKGSEYFKQKYNIGIWTWELSHPYPEEWVSNQKYFDEIWVYTNFMRASMSRKLSIPVVKITYPVYLESNNITNVRSKYAIREDEFVFLFVFDYHSIFERKNPLAVIQAFKKAFDPKQKVMLVLKSMNSSAYPHYVKALHEAASGYNVKFIDEHVRKSEVNSLLASCDCYVSLHRSEGFGLTMAEAMYLGKPVIATSYSGNMDFMNVNNSFLVKYDLVELDQDYVYYKKGNVWAEPSVDHASELMQNVYNDKERSIKIGKAASSYIKEHLNPHVTGVEITNRLNRVKSNHDF